jgi:peptidoglycan hydrolase CwlO-like protein
METEKMEKFLNVMKNYIVPFLALVISLTITFASINNRIERVVEAHHDLDRRVVKLETTITELNNTLIEIKTNTSNIKEDLKEVKQDVKLISK